jgi:hypothetical protein
VIGGTLQNGLPDLKIHEAGRGICGGEFEARETLRAVFDGLAGMARSDARAFDSDVS